MVESRTHHIRGGNIQLRWMTPDEVEDMRTWRMAKKLPDAEPLGFNITPDTSGSGAEVVVRAGMSLSDTKATIRHEAGHLRYPSAMATTLYPKKPLLAWLYNEMLADYHALIQYPSNERIQKHLKKTKETIHEQGATSGITAEQIADADRSARKATGYTGPEVAPLMGDVVQETPPVLIPKIPLKRAQPRERAPQPRAAVTSELGELKR